MKPIRLLPVIAASVTIFNLSSCGNNGIISINNSSLDTVDIPQTSVKNQDKAGFCWAYATAGFIESIFKAKTGEIIDVSEEAIAFYRVIEEMRYYVKEYQTKPQATSEEILKAIKESSFQGWFLRHDPNDKSPIPMRDTYEIVDEFGVIPEAAWSFKFDNEIKTKNLEQILRTGLSDLISTKGKSNPIIESELQALAAKAFGSVPPSTFIYKGNSVTSRQFARNVLKFRSADYAPVSAASSRDFLKIVKAVKRSLVRGISVPIGFGVNFKLLKNGTFGYENKTDEFYDNIPQEKAAAFFGADGGHAVLVTDFINFGGAEGAMSSADLLKQFNLSPETLSYLKIKNSWGANANSNEVGIDISGSQDGYYKLDIGYLKGNADAGFLSVVVPLDIAKNPDAPEAGF